MSRIRTIVLVSIAFTMACASAGGGGGGASGAPGEVVTSAKSGEAEQNRITAAEIEQAGLPNAYELVNRLRRQWLRRDPRTGNAVAVVMDGQNIGTAAKLREIPAVEVAELQYMSYDDAVKRWGSTVNSSVIVVIRRR